MAVVFYRGGLIFAVLVTGMVCAIAGCAAAPPGRVTGGAAGVEDSRADGRVIRVGEGEVYINLGKRDRVREGMPFGCFDGRLGVVPGVAGTGAVEVVEVKDDFAICRITRVAANRGIHEGDLLFNAVYHHARYHGPHFVIDGDFDVMGTGVATAADRERLEMLIRNWGGVVDAEVNAQTDYLVLGKRPASPTNDPRPVVVKGDVVDHRSDEQKRYDQLLDEARRLAIPVLNLNRALNLIASEGGTLAQR